MSAPPTSRRRRLGFVALAVLLAGVVLEVGAWLLLASDLGTPVPWTVLAQRRRELLEATEPGVDDFDGLDGSGTTEDPGDPVEQRVERTTVLHPFLGFVRAPGTLSEFSKDSTAFGFGQNTGFFFEPSPERVVVGLLGGSVARFLAVQDAALETALEALPRFRGRDVVVVAMAAGGYKQPQQVAALNWFLSLGAHFDLLINVDGFNEVALPAHWNVPRGVFPFYPQQWEIRVDALGPRARQTLGLLTWQRERRKSFARVAQRAPLRWSSTAQLAWTIADRRIERRIREAQVALEHSEFDPQDSYQARGPQRSWSDPADMYRDLAAHWARCSVQIDRLARGLGIEYHHFLQPNQYVPDSKPLAPEELRLAFAEKHHFREPVVRGYPALREAGADLRSRGVAFHDLVDVFADDTAPLYRDLCCHLDSTGNRLLAEAVARGVQQGPAGSLP